MKNLLLGALCLGLLSAFQAPPADSTKSQDGPLALGVDTSNFDRTVRPQDDIDRFVNGTWLSGAEIPADKSSYGTITEVVDKSEKDLLGIIEEAAGARKVPGSDLQKVGDMYLSFMDSARVEALGLTPLNGELARLEAISTREDLIRYMGYGERIGIGSPVAVYVGQDAKNTTEYILTVTQSGLGLPDRDYYLDERFADVRESYGKHLTAMYDLAGWSGAEIIMDLERRLAERQWTRVQNRDRNATYNKLTIEEAQALTPSFDWSLYLAEVGIGDVDAMIVRQPTYFAAFDTIFATTPVEDWKTYFRYKLLKSAAPYLSRAFVDENFDFYGRTLSGTEQNRPRWKRAVSATEGVLGEVIGKLYVERHFRPEAKSRMDEMIANLRDAFRESIDGLEWMGPETKLEAQAKLAKFTPKIGYPDKWKDYSGLTIAADDLLGNIQRSRALEHERMIEKLGKPVDRSEWFMTPQTVNAYYSSTMNEVVFPAAILQPPFFNVEADDAVNYGAIGAVIGHEFSHGFDDQGRKSDGDGNLRDWWTEEDNERFQERAAGLVAQYNEFSPLEGMHVNGELTLGENIGDLAGLTMAYRAYKRSLDGKEAPVIGGFTGDQRFFLGWAQVWRRAYRDEELKQRLVTDSHSPSEYRSNGVVRNMPEFYEAFGVEEGDGMYLPAEERVKIW